MKSISQACDEPYIPVQYIRLTRDLSIHPMVPLFILSSLVAIHVYYGLFRGIVEILNLLLP
jgi:hypothetical protein